MELWIRSQDRETLIKTENISIDNENYIIGNLISDDNKSICDYWRLGHYETRERALEVLDEIHKLLKPQLYLKQWESVVKQEVDELVHIVNPTYEEVKELSTYVYEMPKE